MNSTKFTSTSKIKLIGLRDGMLEQIRRSAMDDETLVWKSPVFLKAEDVLTTIEAYEESVLRKLSRRNDDAFSHDDIKDLIACLVSLVSMELTIAELERHEIDKQEVCGILRHVGLK